MHGLNDIRSLNNVSSMVQVDSEGGRLREKYTTSNIRKEIVDIGK